MRALLAGSAGQEVGGIEPDAIAAAGALLAAGPVTVVLGRPNLAESADGVVAAAAAIHAAHPEVRFLSALRRGNVHGALDMGLAPGLLPGRTTLDDGGDWFRDARVAERPAASAASTPPASCEAAAAGKVDVLVLLGADPLADFPDTDLATRALAGARTVIAVDRFLTASAAAGRRRAGRRRARRGRRHHHQHRGARQHRRPQDHAAGHRPRRLDARRRARPPARHRPRARVARPDPRRRSRAVAPSHAGLTAGRAPGAGGRDGVLVGAPDRRPAEPPSTPPPGVDPAAGEAAVAAAGADTDEEQQAAEAEATEAQADAEEPTPGPAGRRPPARRAARVRRADGRPRRRRSTPTRCASSPPASSTTSAPTCSTSPGLAGLTSDTALRLHPHDFDRLGVDAGAVVTVTSSSRHRHAPRACPTPASAAARPPSCSTSPGRRSARSSTPPPRSPRSGW